MAFLQKLSYLNVGGILKCDDELITVMNDIIDDVTLGLCFEVHRSSKLGTLFLGDTDPQSQVEHAIVDRPGVDVFGNPPAKKQLECVCPNCQRNLAASRFAPHLEKCMGMGRNSSRIASRRSQKVLKDRLGQDPLKHDSGESDDDYNDADWSMYPDKKIKKLRKEKRSNSPRRHKNSRLKNGSALAESSLHLSEMAYKQERADTPDSIGGYEYMTLEDKKTLLMSTCGVISGHTKKMCTRSHKCPQHSDEQRRQVRHFLLGTGLHGDDDDNVDIDTYVDGDSQSLRESLQWEAASNTSSPTDSTSTNNSNSNSHSSSRKRHGKSSSKSSKKRKLAKSHSYHSSVVSNSQLPNMYEFD
ncbi:ataxin-7-like protein 3 isoform X1 [Mercenaria mercenaria]|uniref:ataxin-7-like protein 3 isoform X1 n=1 Tax=Mercenaria mercenaria TaxID=6596 RepID=UPI00234F443E|nr:ataxin-7-like protein 3 isoform X1 [Mercenaria mercenaria]